MGLGKVVREEVVGICIRINIKVDIKVKVKVKANTPVDRDMVVKGMDKINTKVDTKTKDTKIKTKINIEDKAKVIMELLDHTTRINTILDSILGQVISHPQTLLRGIILRASPCPLLPLDFSFPSHPIPPISTSSKKGRGETDRQGSRV